MTRSSILAAQAVKSLPF